MTIQIICVLRETYAFQLTEDISDDATINKEYM